MATDHDFSYSVKCPACVAQDGDTSSTMGLTLATGKFTCTGENQHEFDVLPGESEPAAVAPEVPEAKRLEAEPEVEAAPVAQEVKDAEESRLVVITEKIKLGDPGVPDSPHWHGKQPYVVMPSVLAEFPLDPEKLSGLSDDEPAFDRAASVSVGLGEFKPLPGGDILVGLRVSELWVSAMQSEAIGQNQDFMEYVQQLFDQALVDYNNSLPAPR